MLKKFAAVAVHLVFFALVMAIAAYWGVRIFTPAPTASPPPIAPPPLRDPDPVAVAFETRAYAAPQLIVADVGIEDGSGNGQVEPQEVVNHTGSSRTFRATASSRSQLDCASAAPA